MEVTSVERKKVCSNCRAEFSCYTVNCWCSKLPNVMPLNPDKDCLCPECLEKEISQKLELHL